MTIGDLLVRNANKETKNGTFLEGIAQKPAGKNP